ncbi:IPExxxVDY family protein [uncultured Flavobacterium sp.]|uniref:IPExxxVDY family protein n=1 Tax=uncultured Flavobacterium sp. TaxID=165435 RepID=UPI0030C82927
MAIFKLQLEEFSTTEYELIAIHTTIEVSKLAFLLNKNLNTRFHFLDVIDKKEKKEKGSFERYLYCDEEKDVSWNLLENKSIINGASEQESSLFDQFGQTMYLIPEVKKADYILKIDSEDAYLDIPKIIQTISEINTISLSYYVDKNTIKTKSNLIF